MIYVEPIYPTHHPVFIPPGPRIFWTGSRLHHVHPPFFTQIFVNTLSKKREVVKIPTSIWPLDSVDRMHCLWSLRGSEVTPSDGKKRKPHSSHLIAHQWMEYMRFFFRNCQGKGGTEFQNDYDVTVFFVSFFCVNRWLLQILQWPNSVCIWLPKPAHVFFWTALCTWKPITTVGWYVHVVNSRCNKRREYIMWKRVFGVCAMKFCEIWCLNVSIMLHWKKQIAKHIHLSLVVFGWKPRV